MQPHAVPQNITGFEFKLIGNLTLRQFGYVGVAAVLDFILYSAKVPLLGIILIGGPISLLALALAFLPVNDQPFERWFVSLLKTFYSPSVRVWHREPKQIGFLEPQFSFYLHRQESFEEPRVVSDRTKLDTYLSQSRRQKGVNPVDADEQSRLAALPFGGVPKASGVFTNQSVSSAATIASETAPKPNEAVNQGLMPRLKRMSEVVEGIAERKAP